MGGTVLGTRERRNRKQSRKIRLSIHSTIQQGGEQMSRKSVLNLFALLIIASVLLAACGTPAEVTEAPAPVEQPTEAPQPTEVPQPSVFIFGRGGDSVQLDPIVVTDGESYR